MRRIAVVNQKGGCGKTTVCVHIAVGLLREQQRVVVFDSDRQESAIRWAQKAPAFKRKAPPLSAVLPDQLAAALQAASSDFDVALIDTAGDFKADAQRQVVELLEHVDLVIVPVLPTPLDVEGAHDLLQALTEYKKTHDTPNVVIVINKAKRNQLTRDAREALPQYGFPVLTTAMQDRVAYAYEVGFGGTAFDRRPSDPARKEIATLLNEVRTYL